MMAKSLREHILNIMKAPAPAVLISLPLAAVAAWLVPIAIWENLRPALLPAQSVVAAAVLVRLARGFPFTNADHFTLPEVQAVGQKLTSIALKLRTMMFVCLAAMIQLIIYPSTLTLVSSLPPAFPIGIDVLERTMSALIGGASVYAFVRILEVVQVDISLLKLQATLVEKAVARKNAKAFDDELAKAPPRPITGAERYGSALQ